MSKVCRQYVLIFYYQQAYLALLEQVIDIRKWISIDWIKSNNVKIYFDQFILILIISSPWQSAIDFQLLLSMLNRMIMNLSSAMMYCLG